MTLDPEWNLSGQQIVDNKLADDVGYVKCTSELIQAKKCPLLRQVNKRQALSSKLDDLLRKMTGK